MNRDVKNSVVLTQSGVIISDRNDNLTSDKTSKMFIHINDCGCLLLKPRVFHYIVAEKQLHTHPIIHLYTTRMSPNKAETALYSSSVIAHAPDDHVEGR